MNDALRDEAKAVRRWSPLAVLLVACGALAAIAGVTWTLASNASAGNVVFRASSIPTLPVHSYVQYTQHFIAPDSTGIQFGPLVAVLGLIVFLVGITVAVTKRRIA
ncbi:hypothetical protein G3T36_12785 [Diaminobutyricibacter tongyongensis]|uniref:Uncharacterized protein n=1 Tax=Leifsonia tongyongensis TaxID=1268043 RepID=A0A6L9XZ83_9MICO|nr:hypothetical protein [Diaminobutyricibacter tongyongensis]NEN06742.1 hypothetical protein [Diaminobutyricibacter tongyongensis]